MSCLILPTVDFSNSSKSNKSNKSKSRSKSNLKSKSIKKSQKSVKQICKNKPVKKLSKSINNKNSSSKNIINKASESSNSSEYSNKSEKSDIDDIDIDDIDTICENDFSSTESSNDTDNTNKANKIDTHTENTFDSPPVYDGVEEYYLFKRRWDAYMDYKLNNTLRNYILEFINALFDTEYTNLMYIERIDENIIPASKYVVDLIKEDPNYKKLFKIRCSTNISSPKMINSLLNKVGFSFVKMVSNKGSYYCVKSGIVDTSINYI